MILDDLAEFARLEVESHDLEPWAEVMRSLRDAERLDEEGAHWLAAALRPGDSEEDGYRRLLPYLRSVWGVGRQTAFEWAEFLTKVLGVRVAAPDAQLWESEGPRRSIERLYEAGDAPTLAWLDDRAAECRDFLADRGVPLSWEDFETIICDFNVMRDGRYYPGRHLAALAEELASIPEADRGDLLAAWHEVIPEPWAGIVPGIDKAKLAVYRDSGVILAAP